jgi:predicted nucleotidyltransferase
LSINIEELSGQILPVLKRFGVKKAAIFGSQARGEGGRKSDVDIVVEFVYGG